MDGQKSIGLGFSAIIILLLGTGALAIFYLNTIAMDVENLYRHPYAVSNAARDVKINLISIHNYMNDVVLAEDEKQILKATSLIDKYEHQVHKSFDIIFARYLGERSDIESVYEVFMGWKIIRDEVIFLKASGKNKEASVIIQNRGNEHVKLLNKETQKLIDFADNKAKIFFNNALSIKKHALTVVSILLLITVIVSILISYYIVKRLKIVQVDIKSRMHLIDQNILMAKFDLNGVVLDISNKLCRYLGLIENEVMGKKTDFFIQNNTSGTKLTDILMVAATGKVWAGDICITCINGEKKWIHSSIHPKLDDNYVVCGYTNLVYDISDRKAIEQLSFTDPLTTLNNRRLFDQVLNNEIKIANRNKTLLTLSIIDIDYFKKYNDHYGHPAGDSALIKVAQVLKHSMKRPNDYAFRIGGEEFGLVFSSLDQKETIALLDTIREKVAQLQIEHNGSNVSESVTISIGAHVMDNENMLNSDQLYIKADEALYKAKENRNCVQVT